MTWLRLTIPRSIDTKTYNLLPDSLTIRECRVQLSQPGFRVQVLVIATTLLDHNAYPPSALAELYRARWNAELDLKSLKQTLQMDVLRCKTPELVRTELWTHILAYIPRCAVCGRCFSSLHRSLVLRPLPRYEPIDCP